MDRAHHHTGVWARVPLGCLWATVGLGLAGGPGGLAAADPTPEQQIEALYGTDLKKVKVTPATADDLTLAQKLIEDGVAARQNKLFQGALLRRAYLLALDDPTDAAAQAAEKAMEGLIGAQVVTAASGWQELGDKASQVLRRRNQGRKDPLLMPYLGWLRKQAEAALAQGDGPAAERAINMLVREAQYQKCKYEADEAAQFLARVRFEAPFRAAVKRDWTPWQEQPGDAALRRKAGEAALTQMGDWTQAVTALEGVTEGDWPVILRARAARLHPPPKPIEGEEDKKAAEDAPAVKPAPLTAEDLLHAADMLQGLSAQKSTTPPGRAALTAEALALMTAADSADQAGLSTQQRLELAGKSKQAQAAATKAQAEYDAAFARAARINWIALVTANGAADWSTVGLGTQWTFSPGEVLEGTGNWDSMLRSQRAPKLADFVLEGEYSRRSEDAHPFIVFREHARTPLYSLEISSGHMELLFLKGGGADERRVENFDFESEENKWIKFRLVFEGERYRLWINDRLVMNGSDSGDLTAGGLCLGAANGTVWYRNLRVRELQ